MRAVSLSRRDFLKNILIGSAIALAPELAFSESYSSKAKELYRRIWNLEGQDKDSKKPVIQIYTATAEVSRTIDVEDKEYIITVEGYVGRERLRDAKSLPKIRKYNDIDTRYQPPLIDIQQRVKSEDYEKYRTSLISVKDIGLDGIVDEGLTTGLIGTIRNPKDPRWNEVCKETHLTNNQEMSYRQLFNNTYHNNLDTLLKHLKGE